MPEHRQSKGRLGDEDVARNDLEGLAGGVGFALVVARDHHDEVRESEPDLGRTQHVASGVKADASIP